MPKEMVLGECGVTILGRSGLRYRESSRTAFIDAEMLTGAVDLVVYVKTIREWEGTNQPVSDAERDQIVANIASVLRQNRVTVEFQ